MKRMRSFFAWMVILLPVIASAQNNITAKDKFYNYFVEVYIELSKPPLVNYFDNLSNTIEVSFARENNTFIPALAEIAKGGKISEEAASDSLYRYVIKKLLAEKLWANYGDTYKEYGAGFQSYNDALCPCLAENFKENEYVQKLAGAMQNCVGKIATDSAVVAGIREKIGGKSWNELSRKQQYLTLYIYEHCDVMQKAMNQSLRQQAYSSYDAARSMEKSNRAKDLLSYFRDKKMDSLARIFPSYKKFTKELAEALALSQTKGTRNTTYSLFNDGEKSRIVNFYNDTDLLGDLVISFTADEILAPVSKITFNKETRKDDRQNVMEIKDDTGTPVKQ